jgi:hypothetical protein
VISLRWTWCDPPKERAMGEQDSMSRGGDGSWSSTTDMGTVVLRKCVWVRYLFFPLREIRSGHLLANSCSNRNPPLHFEGDTLLSATIVGGTSGRICDGVDRVRSSLEKRCAA